MNKSEPYQMNREKAIAWFDRFLLSEKMMNEEAASAIKFAVADMRRSQHDNEPLTLEQLREMGGEPVWIDGAYPNGWRICYGKRPRKRHGRNVINFGNGVFQFEDEYGKTWLAYHRPPEKSGNVSI